MDLRLDPAAGARYTSESQRARSVTEAWAAKNMYCLACSSPHLCSEPTNTPVKDYTCPECGAAYQLKSQARRFGRSVTNSAYARKLQAIREGQVPHYLFLQYTKPAWRVTDLFVVPSYFITLGAIEQRPPLPDHARRRGWVGSKILLNELPSGGQVSVVESGIARSKAHVRSDWQKFDFLGADRRASGGWGAEILTCVRKVNEATEETEFTLQDFYSRFLPELSGRHPENNNIEAKIRQQLQVLRDGGVLRFLGRGRYRVLD